MAVLKALLSPSAFTLQARSATLLCCLTLVWSTVYVTPGQILLLSIEGAFAPAAEDYLQRAFQGAMEETPSLIIIGMDTPGGLDTAILGYHQHLYRWPPTCHPRVRGLPMRAPIFYTPVI